MVYIVRDTFERISLTEVNSNAVHPSHKKKQIIKNFPSKENKSHISSN